MKIVERWINYTDETRDQDIKRSAERIALLKNSQQSDAAASVFKVNASWRPGNWNNDGLPISIKPLLELCSLLRSEFLVDSSHSPDKRSTGRGKKQNYETKKAQANEAARTERKFLAFKQSYIHGIREEEHVARAEAGNTKILEQAEEQRRRYQAANLEKQQEKAKAAEEQSARNATFAAEILAKIERMTAR